MRHERVLFLNIQTASLLHTVPESRLEFKEIAPGFASAVLTFGFLDTPDVPTALEALPSGWAESPMRTSCMLGRQILAPASKPGMSLWREALFATMVPLSGSAIEYFRLPPGRVIELSNQIEI